MQHASTRFLSMSREEVLEQSVRDEAEILAMPLPEETVNAYADLAIKLAQAPEPVKVLVHKSGIASFDIESGNVTLLDPREAKWMKSDLGTAQMSQLRAGGFVSIDGHIVWEVELGELVTRDPITEQREAASKAARGKRTEWREAV